MMTQPVRDLSITVKLSAGLGAILAIIVAMGILIIVQMSHLADEQNRAATAGQAADLAAALHTDIETTRGAVREFLLTGAKNQRLRAEQAFTAYETDSARLQETLAYSDAHMRSLADVKTAQIRRDVDSGLRSELTLGTNPATRARAIALVAAPESAQHRDRIDQALGQINGALVFWSTDLDQQARDAMQDTLGVIAIGVAAAAIMIALTAAYLVTGICAPLRRMTQSLRRLAEGELEAEMPSSDRGDEIGDIARAIAVFRTAALEKLRLEEDARIARTVADNRRQHDDRIKAILSAEQVQTLSTIDAALERVASGDLNVRIDAPFPEIYEPLRLRFNQSILRLREAIGEVAHSSVAMKDNCQALEEDGSALAVRSDQQATRLERSVVSLAEITQAVQQTAKAADTALGVAAAARQDTLRSGEIIKRAKSTMCAIENFIRRIGHISGTINSISVQTNLLAFNASVEAARGSKANTGFNVIATEIRALANQAQASASEIKSIIANSDTLIQGGVALVGDVSQALDMIGSHVAKLDDQSQRIACAAGEQARNLTHVNDAIGEVGSLALENREMADRAQFAMVELTAQSTRLSRLVGRFQIEAHASSRSLPHGQPDVGAGPGDFLATSNRLHQQERASLSR